MTLTKEDLLTPALLLDLDIFQANLKKMARHVRRHGKSFRPHAKTHKCLQVAQRQIEIGALGVCVATVPEAEIMVQGDVRGVLLTSPLGTADKVGRMTQLAGKDPDLMVVVDHPHHVERYQEAAQAAGRTMNVLVGIDVGDRRTGALPRPPVLDLASHAESNFLSANDSPPDNWAERGGACPTTNGAPPDPISPRDCFYYVNLDELG